MKTKWKVSDVWNFSPHDRDYASSFLLKNDINIANQRLSSNPSLKSQCDIPVSDVKYELNSFGFRCDEFKNISADEDIFIFVGCSFTFGSAVRYSDTWAFKAHQLIQRSRNKPIRFINLGWPGAGLDYFARILVNFCRHFNFQRIQGIFCLCPNVRRFEIPLSIDTTPNIFAHHFPSINIDDDNYELMNIARTKNQLIQNDNFCLNECVKSVNQIMLLAKSLDCENVKLGFMDNEGDSNVVDSLIRATGISNNLFDSCRYDLAPGLGIDYLHPGQKWHSEFVAKNLNNFI